MSFDAPPDPVAPPALQQHPLYARTVEAMGGCTRSLVLSAPNGRQIGTAQTVLRRLGPLRLAWVPRGPVWTAPASPVDRRGALRALRADLPPRTMRVITFANEVDAFGLPLVPARDHAVLDLAPEPAILRAALHGKWRNRLSRAERAGLAVTHRPLDPLRDLGLIAREEAQRRARGYRALPPAFAQTWARGDPRATRLFVTEGAEGPTAFMLFLLHGRGATYHAGWTGPAGRATHAHTLTLWRAMLWLRDAGVTHFDLGHIDRRRAPGLARFKLGSGARVARTGPTCLLL